MTYAGGQRATMWCVALVLGAALAACATAARDPGESTSGEGGGARVHEDDGAPADGVLARARGRGGVELRVEQRGDRRLLFIGDTLHAAVPWRAGRPDPAAVDPVVELARALRPAARTALVIGLGSGKTAGDLARAGFQVTAVEIDPAVIELARTHFGYRGAAVAQDGLAYLRDEERAFDLVLMDAFAGLEPPPELVTAAAIELLRRRTAAGGLTALRMHGAPGDRIVGDVRARLRRTRAGHYFDLLLGSGVGGERQNLYLVASDAPLSAAGAAGLPLWPVPAGELASAAPGAGAPDRAAAGRELTVVGYVHRLAGGALALDLPHQEMGAVRYLLAGDRAARLAGALPDGARFPTRGDIASDGDTSGTLAPLLGGGGVKRSDVRFSPLVAALSGRAHLVALIHPDAASRVPHEVRGDGPTDERLPWGGALYELAVAEVHWTLDRAGWRALEPTLAPRAAAAAAAARTGDLAGGAERLGEYLAALSAALGAHAQLVPAHRAARLWREALAAEAERARGKGGTPFAVAAACDRVHQRVRPAAGLGPAEPLADGLYRCAVDHYERALREQTGAYAYDAAARLLTLLDPERAGVTMSRAEARRAERRRRALQKTSRAIPMPFPPGSIE